MTLFQKRNKRRRFSLARSKPLPEATGITVAPRGKGTGRLLMTVVFLVGTVIVLNLPRSGPRLRVGQIAKRDYIARTHFRVLDAETTRLARAKAAGQAVRVYTEKRNHLQRVPRALSQFLSDMLDDKKSGELDRAAQADWGLAPEDLDALRKVLRRAWVAPGVEAVRAALEKAGGEGIMTASDREAEIASKRYQIDVILPAASEAPERRSIARVHARPMGLQRFFQRELLDWFLDKPQWFRETMLSMLIHAVRPTLKLDKAATTRARTAARDGVKEVSETISEGSAILSMGEEVTESALERIKMEAAAFSELPLSKRDKEGEWERLWRALLGALGMAGVFLIGFALLALYGLHFAAEALMSNTRVFGVYTVCFLTLLAVRVFERVGVALHWTPVIFAAMLLAVATGPMLALGAAALLAVLAGIVTDSGMALAVPLLAAATLAILELIHLRNRTDPVVAGLVAGMAYAATVWVLYLARIPLGHGVENWLVPASDSAAGFGGGVISGIVLTASLPYVERFFDVATDMRLLEWTDQNQPLLRKLALEAPGTYHHSTVVSHMAEAAAKTIGANALLARAGAYLHDVGKLNRPDYFVENAVGRPSRHKGLSPAMSTLILTAHTKDGAELARSYGVPTPLRRTIVEHHGTTVAEYFYREACKEMKNAGSEVNRDTFRYRGPKPRCPESAIVMLADSAESAARSLDNASASKIERLVHEVVESRLDDGQLDESRMSITDIRRVESSLVRSLTAVSHPRIRYPAT